MFRYLLLFILVFQGCISPEDNSYASLIEESQSKGLLNGNVLVAENGNIVYQSAFGLESIETLDSLNLESQFRLASVSKNFTAMAILTLVSSGKIAIDDPLSTYVPELPYKGITIRHLLNHTSGLPDYEALFEEKWKPEFANDERERFISGNEDIIDLLVEYTPEVSFAPGEKWEYSNTGYVLLATTIMRVSGTSFPEYLAKNLFSGAGMSQTLVFDPIQISPMPHRVDGFNQEGNNLVSSDIHFLNPVQGDGGIYSTSGDLHKWDQFLYNQKLMPDSLLQMAYTSGTLNNGAATGYGFGWNVTTSPDGAKAVAHGGGWVGFSTYFYRDLENHHSIIILTNNSSGDVRDIFEGLKEIMYRP